MISRDVKYRAIVHYVHFQRSLRKVSALYNVSKSSLHRWILNSEKAQKPQKRKKHVMDQAKQKVRKLVQQNPFITLDNLSHAIASTCKIQRSRHTMGRLRRDCGFTRKKVSRVINASSPSDSERASLFCKVHESSDGNIVCIDEAGFVIGDHGRYGYVSRGQKLNIIAGRSLRRTKLTLLLAVAEHGIIDYQILSHNCKKSDFVHFIDGLMIPPGTSLLMDNIPFHHSKETQSSVEKKGCTCLFIPPYSPKFNAIENVFGVLKRKFRSCCPSTPSSEFDYRSLMERVLQNSMDNDFTSFFQRALAFSTRINRGEPFVNYEN